MKTRLIPFILAVGACAAVALVWLVAGVWGLAQSGHVILTFCHSLLERCAGYMGLAGLASLALGVTVVAGGIVYGVSRNVYRFFKASAVIKAMPKTDTGSSVVLVRDGAVLSAFTWGLFAPRIYLSTGLVSALTREELRAVCLHEAAHRRGLDPLRFLLLNTLSDIFVYIPLARQFAAGMRAMGEFAADDYAVSRTGEAVSLASALLKVSAFGMTGVPMPVSFAGYGPPSERITRLFNDACGAATPPVRRSSLRAIAVSIAMASFLTFAFFGPLSVRTSHAGVCATKHCTLHARAERLGQACKAHCATGNASHAHLH